MNCDKEESSMSLLTFSDGMTFNLSGPMRVTLRSDGWYVVGGNMLIPVRDKEEGDEFIRKHKESNE